MQSKLFTEVLFPFFKLMFTSSKTYTKHKEKRAVSLLKVPAVPCTEELKVMDWQEIMPLFLSILFLVFCMSEEQREAVGYG